MSSEDGFISPAMLQGSSLETVGISLFKNSTGLSVEKVGFIQSKKYRNAGYSPDGVVYGKDGRIETIIEHKAFYEERHLKNKNRLEISIIYQIQFGIFISGAKDAYLILYNK